MTPNPYQQYRTTRVETAGPVGLAPAVRAAS